MMNVSCCIPFLVHSGVFAERRLLSGKKSAALSRDPAMRK